MASEARNFKKNAQAGTYKECDGLGIYKVFSCLEQRDKTDH